MDNISFSVAYKVFSNKIGKKGHKLYKGKVSVNEENILWTQRRRSHAATIIRGVRIF